MTPDDRSIRLALLAVTSGVLALGFFALSAWLPAFESCRMGYRMPRAVYASLACQAYAAITWFALSLSAAAVVLVLAVGVRHYAARYRRRG